MISQTLAKLSKAFNIKKEKHPDLQDILANTGWLFGDRILRMGVGLLVGVWVARYLGPEQYGALNFAFAYIALFAVFGHLGLKGIVVREIVRNPGSAMVVLGSTILLQLIAGAIAMLFAAVSIGVVRPESPTLKLMVIVLGLTLIIKATDVVKYWYEAQIKSRYVVIVENSSFLVVAIVKILLIFSGASLMAFVWVVLLETMMIAAGFVWVYSRGVGSLRLWRIDLKVCGQLIKDSWPLILSGLAIMVYLRIDQVMLGKMLGDDAVGIYSAAVRLSEVWYFIPMAIVASVFPSILKTKDNSEERYYKRIQQLCDLMVALGVVVAVIMTFSSDWVVVNLFGNEYQSAGRVLAVHVWAGVFVFQGLAVYQWFLSENLQRLGLYRTAFGAALNVVLNYLLIPKYGPVGAALATVAAQALPGQLLDLFDRRTRRIWIIRFKSFFFVRRFSEAFQRTRDKVA